MHKSDDDDPYTSSAHAQAKIRPWWSEVRKRQLIVFALLVANYFVVSWLVAGDPTLGETARLVDAEQARRGHRVGGGGGHDDGGVVSGGGDAAASWCHESAEARHNWRVSQRIAGPTFRRRVDLCATTSPTTDLFARENANDVDDDDDAQHSWWDFRVLKSRVATPFAAHSSPVPQQRQPPRCGLTSVRSRLSPASRANVSWLLVPEFLALLDDHRDARDDLGGSANAAAMRRALYASCAPRGGTDDRSSSSVSSAFDDQPIEAAPSLLAAARDQLAAIDIAWMHSALTPSEAARLEARYDGGEFVADPSDVGGHRNAVDAKTTKKDTYAPRASSGLLQTAALAAQHLAVHSCATPVGTIANVVVVASASAAAVSEHPTAVAAVVGVGATARAKGRGSVDDASPRGADDDAVAAVAASENEFAAWRLWVGGPLIMAAVCRRPPFHVTIEVSPSASWVEMIE